MIDECAEVGVLFNEAERYGVRLHKVPRSLFDLIPGEERAITAAQPLWVKSMMLGALSTAGEPGKHVELTMYCSEAAPTQPPPFHRGGDEEPLLRESEPEMQPSGEMSNG